VGERGVALVDHHLSHHGDHRHAEAGLLEPLPHGVLQDVADLALGGGDAGVVGHPVGAGGRRLGADQHRAHLGTVAVGQDHPVPVTDQLDHAGGGLHRVGELLVGGPRLVGADQGVAADGHEHEFRHGLGPFRGCTSPEGNIHLGYEGIVKEASRG
jgi:hypothetical protein